MTKFSQGKLGQLLEQTKDNEKIISQLKSKIAKNEGNELLNKAIKIKDFVFLSEIMPSQNANELREMIDKLKNPISLNSNIKEVS